VRGALPLLAFTTAKLWEYRDKESKHLPLEAYEEIEGVEGALAGHAEATLEQIGSDKIPIVRELFRNLTTAQSTRSVQSQDELLSVFGPDDQAEAAQVLDKLIDARLLVSFQNPSLQEEMPLQASRPKSRDYRIEIVHESLLRNWPRLVRWQTQDTEGTQLRDVLRQTAQIWDQQNRAEDLLWTGMAYKEYEVWRVRYPGGLTDLEKAFGEAMSKHVRLRSRRKRLAVTAVLVFALLAVLGTGTMWRRSVSETRRAEAAHLLALAQKDPEADPTAAVAYATKSLELFDTEVARFFVTEILTQGPIAYTRDIMSSDYLWMEFSPDGKHLAAGGHGGLHEIWHSDGSPTTRLTGLSDQCVPFSIFSHDSRFMASWNTYCDEREMIVWELPEFKQVNRFKPESGFALIHPDGIITLSKIEGKAQNQVRLTPFEGDGFKDLGQWPRFEEPWNKWHYGSDTFKHVIIFHRENKSEFYLLSGLPDQASAPRKFAEIPGDWQRAGFLRDGNRFSTFSASKEINIWSLDPEHTSPLLTLQGPQQIMNRWGFDTTGQWMATANGYKKNVSVWNLTGPIAAGPRILRRGDRVTAGVAIHPKGDWIAVSDATALSLWPLRSTYPSVLFRESIVTGLIFDPNGKWLAGSTVSGKLLLWSLESTGDYRHRLLHEQFEGVIAVSPDGSQIASPRNDTILILPVSGAA
jgi:WD40 repeat protein